jgi:hypothetical protein
MQKKCGTKQRYAMQLQQQAALVPPTLLLMTFSANAQVA